MSSVWLRGAVWLQARGGARTLSLTCPPAARLPLQPGLLRVAHTQLPAARRVALDARRPRRPRQRPLVSLLGRPLCASHFRPSSPSSRHDPTIPRANPGPDPASSEPARVGPSSAPARPSAPAASAARLIWRRPHPPCRLPLTNIISPLLTFHYRSSFIPIPIDALAAAENPPPHGHLTGRPRPLRPPPRLHFTLPPPSSVHHPPPDSLRYYHSIFVCAGAVVAPSCP